MVTDGAEVVEVEASAEVAEVAVEAVAPAVAVSGAASGELLALMEGDRSLAILFGSQTGNAAGLAEKTAKLAANYGLIPTVYDMDGLDVSTLANHKRTLIITSTWGEGEMPDNAESLWQTVNSQGPSLSGVNFSVCAIGDTSMMNSVKQVLIGMISTKHWVLTRFTKYSCATSITNLLGLHGLQKHCQKLLV